MKLSSFRTSVINFNMDCLIELSSFYTSVFAYRNLISVTFLCIMWVKFIYVGVNVVTYDVIIVFRTNF